MLLWKLENTKNLNTKKSAFYLSSNFTSIENYDIFHSVISSEINLFLNEKKIKIKKPEKLITTVESVLINLFLRQKKFKYYQDLKENISEKGEDPAETLPEYILNYTPRVILPLNAKAYQKDFFRKIYNKKTKQYEYKDYLYFKEWNSKEKFSSKITRLCLQFLFERQMCLYKMGRYNFDKKEEENFTTYVYNSDIQYWKFKTLNKNNLWKILAIAIFLEKLSDKVLTEEYNELKSIVENEETFKKLLTIPLDSYNEMVQLNKDLPYDLLYKQFKNFFKYSAYLKRKDYTLVKENNFLKIKELTDLEEIKNNKYPLLVPVNNGKVNRDLRLINNFKSKFCDSFKYTRIFGKNTSRNGRLYNSVSFLPKTLRNIVFQKMDYEEIDLPCSVFNIMCALFSNEYTPSERKILYQRKIYPFFIDRYEQITESYFMEEYKIEYKKLPKTIQKVYRKITKKCLAPLIGVSSKEQFIFLLEKTLISYGVSENSNKQKFLDLIQKENPDFLKSLKKKKEIDENQKISEIDLISEYYFPIKIEKFLISIEKNLKEIKSILYQNISEWYQNIESQIIVSLEKYAVRKNKLIFTLHDAIYIEKSLKEEFLKELNKQFMIKTKYYKKGNNPIFDLIIENIENIIIFNKNNIQKEIPNLYSTYKKVTPSLILYNIVRKFPEFEEMIKTYGYDLIFNNLIKKQTKKIINDNIKPYICIKYILQEGLEKYFQKVEITTKKLIKKINKENLKNNLLLKKLRKISFKINPNQKNKFLWDCCIKIKDLKDNLRLKEIFKSIKNMIDGNEKKKTLYLIRNPFL